MRKSIYALMAVIVMAMVAGGVGLSQTIDWDISWFRVAGGGGTSAGDGFALSGTAGQHEAGEQLAGGDFTLTGGFQAGVSAPGVQPGVCGDQNGDRVVDIRDVVIDMQIAMGIVPPTATQLELSDLNGDGAINVFDTIMGVQSVVGLTTITDCGAT